jgi:hypothetical protein
LGSGGRPRDQPLSLHLDNSWACWVSIMLRPYASEHSRWCPLDRRLGTPQNWSGYLTEDTHLPFARARFFARIRHHSPLSQKASAWGSPCSSSRCCREAKWMHITRPVERWKSDVTSGVGNAESAGTLGSHISFTVKPWSVIAVGTMSRLFRLVAVVPEQTLCYIGIRIYRFPYPSFISRTPTKVINRSFTVYINNLLFKDLVLWTLSVTRNSKYLENMIRKLDVSYSVQER